MDEKIKEWGTLLAEYKSARNSLLNVSRLPPEILGDIFRRNVALEGTFGGLEDRSYNFLLVCRHWRNVAWNTPEVWSFWGNSLEDWNKWYGIRPTAPLDLVLKEESFAGNTLSLSLRTALQDRVARDAIRRVHLHGEIYGHLPSIISSLAANEETQSSSVESVVVENQTKDTFADVSDLFTYHHFPKLQHLKLVRCEISSWDLLVSRTSTLTTLFLHLGNPTPTPTMSQLLSILDSNPALQEISLYGCAIPEDSGGGGSSPRASLQQLKKVLLAGDPRRIFGLLSRLDHPRNMGHLEIHLFSCTLDDISGIMGPYLREYLRRRGRSPNGLGVSLFPYEEESIVFSVGDVPVLDFSIPGPVYMGVFVEISIQMDPVPPGRQLKEAMLNLVAHAPPEEIVYLQAGCNPVLMADVPTRLPHIRALNLLCADLHLAFPEPIPDSDGHTFPSLQHVNLSRVSARQDDWSPLTAFLSRRASSGYQPLILETSVFNPPHPVREDIRRMVRELRTDDDHQLRTDGCVVLLHTPPPPRVF